MSCLELYDRDAAVAYARQYALSYNPQYANYKSSTGAAGRLHEFCVAVPTCRWNAD